MEQREENDTENEMNDNNNSSRSNNELNMPSEMKMNQAQIKDNWIIVNLGTIAAAVATAHSHSLSLAE